MKADRLITADLYVRVSTDEQADRGYSQRNQEEMLRKYCTARYIEIRDIIYEDHSAKSFNRPEWRKFLANLRRHPNQTDLVLFTKWDRFSRNAGDAYQMINILRGLGVEPQAVEQPLDLSVPENKMMLAIYLAAPEVENDRRALNVFYGMRRAKKEGRYMGLAPVGYENRTDIKGNKYIAPNDSDAAIVTWSFEEIAKGVYNTEQVWKQAKEKGLKCSKSTFWQMIRNPVYCGKIFVSKFKDEESHFVGGRHQPLISEALFEKVQEVLDCRGIGSSPKIKIRDDFPLRGILVCPVCGRLLTASKSKGRNRYYSYYHCRVGCHYRVREEKIDLAIRKELRRYRPDNEVMKIYTKIVAETYYELTRSTQLLKRRLSNMLKELQNKQFHIRDLLTAQKIDPLDYLEVKKQYTVSCVELEKKLKAISQSVPPIEVLLEKETACRMALDEFYVEGNTEDKRNLIGLVYPGKLLFYGTVIGDNKVSAAVEMLYYYN